MKIILNSSKFTAYILLLFLLAVVSGCQSGRFDNNSPPPVPDQSKQAQSPNQLQDSSKQPQSSQQSQTESLLLREGDVLSISIPGSSTLDTSTEIRTDGKIVLPLIGEVVAAGKTPEELQDELLKLYQPQVAAKQVIVNVQSSNIPIYVTGAVLRPGPISVNHPISVLDAVMEAGGFDYTKANAKAVVVVRQEKDRTVRYTLNLKKVLAGSSGQPFYLQPFDIVYVPERFTWY